MVPDAPAIESFAGGDDGFLEAMEKGAVWLQTSTVGAAPADRLIALAAEHGVAIVDAPVLGSKEPAERGEIVMLASGEDQHLDLCEPFFDAVARRVLRLGAAGNGSRLKMVTNGWIMSAVAAIAEAMALAEAFGLEPRSFMAAIAGTPMDMGYAQIKGGMIADGVYPVQMTLANGAKDAHLALEAARALGLPARVIAAAAELMAAARELGWAGDDMAAAYNAAVASAIEKPELQGEK
jgi:3-hydroxyisobutyrate dehydrogenase